MINKLLDIIDGLSWGAIAVFCLTLGLAPFSPPHLIEKFQWLIAGQPLKAIDWFDVFFHGLPWLAAVAKAIVTLRRPPKSEP